MTTSVTILVDDQRESTGLVAEHGFSALVETENASVLFDTAQTAAALSHNARLLGVNMAAISAVVLSHGHYDHTGGLPEVFHGRTGLPLFLHPDAVLPRYSARTNAPPKPVGMPQECVQLTHRLGNQVRLTTSPTEIAGAVWATGPIPRRNAFEDTGGRFFLDSDCRIPDLLNDDQALWLDTKEGIVVLLGCAHAGVINTLDYVAELTGAFNIHAVIGGMHLGAADEDRLRFTVSALQRYGVRVVAPCHCTGKDAMEYLAAHLGGAYVPCFGGKRLSWRPPIKR